MFSLKDMFLSTLQQMPWDMAYLDLFGQSVTSLNRLKRFASITIGTSKATVNSGWFLGAVKRHNQEKHVVLGQGKKAVGEDVEVEMMVRVGD